MFIFLPFAIIYVLAQPHDKLKDNKKFKNAWGALYEDICLKNRANVSYFPVFILRRIFYLILAFYIDQVPVYQIMIFSFTNLLFSSHTGYLQPFETKFYN